MGGIQIGSASLIGTATAATTKTWRVGIFQRASQSILDITIGGITLVMNESTPAATRITTGIKTTTISIARAPGNAHSCLYILTSSVHIVMLCICMRLSRLIEVPMKRISRMLMTHWTHCITQLVLSYSRFPCSIAHVSTESGSSMVSPPVYALQCLASVMAGIR